MAAGRGLAYLRQRRGLNTVSTIGTAAKAANSNGSDSTAFCPNTDLGRCSKGELSGAPNTAHMLSTSSARPTVTRPTGDSRLRIRML